MRPLPETGDDRLVRRFGYRPQFIRSLRSFESFALGFSFISITTGIFTTFGFVLANAGPRGIWTWPIVIVGQTLVAMVYAALAAKIPLAGYSYQWASRLANPVVGWWLGWMSFAFLTIVTVSVDYAFVQAAFQPLLGIAYTPLSAAVQTGLVLAVQATLIIASTAVTTRTNNAAVVFEVVGMVELSIVLLSAAFLAGRGDWSNLWSTGVVPAAGWWGWLGPFMLATLLGAYTIVGFESSANLAEETQEPRKVVPRAMVRAVVASGAVGMTFLFAITLAVGDVEATSNDPAPVAFVLRNVLGSGIERVFLLFICVSIFCCGLVIMATNSRLAWAMARDRRLPGHQLIARVPRATGGPTFATLMVALLSGGIVAVLGNHTDALVNLFTASTLMPAILYAGTVVLYVGVARKLRPEPGYFHLGRWEQPVVFGALLWLAYELIILLAPSDFRAAQRYALGAVLLGLVVFGLMWLIEPDAMRRNRGAEGEDALAMAAEREEEQAADEALAPTAGSARG
jgi:amino acid transporter